MIGTAIGWAVFGLVAGAIARLLVPGKQAMGLIYTMLLGIVGSFLGGFAASLFSGGELIRSSGWIGSIIGAIVVLLIWGGIAKRKSKPIV